jgi:Skp family chaperone for outer membrane proteins
MLNKKDIFLIVALLAIGSVSVFNLFSKANNQIIDKVGYVDVKQVFEEFKLKSELQKKLEKETLAQRNYLDSLMFNIKLLKNKLETSEKQEEKDINHYNKMQTIYFQHKREIEESIGQMTIKYDAQIIGQMTQYINDFGELNQYDFIIGKNENGNLLYGDVKKDLTKEVILFINNKYQGDF